MINYEDYYNPPTGEILNFKGVASFEISKRYEEQLKQISKNSDPSYDIYAGARKISGKISSPKWFLKGMHFLTVEWNEIWEEQRISLVGHLLGVPKRLFKEAHPFYDEANYSTSRVLDINNEEDLHYLFLFIRQMQYPHLEKLYELKELKNYIYNSYFREKIKNWVSKEEVIKHINNSEIHSILLSHVNSKDSGSEILDWDFAMNLYRPNASSKISYPWNLIEGPNKRKEPDSIIIEQRLRDSYRRIFLNDYPQDVTFDIKVLKFLQKFKTEEGETPSLEELRDASVGEGTEDLLNAYNNVARESGLQVIDLKSDPAKITELMQCFLVNKIGRELPIQNTKQNFIFPPWYKDFNPKLNEEELREANYFNRTLPPHFIATQEDDGLLNKLILNKYWGSGGVSRDFMGSNKKATLNSRLYWIYSDDEGNLQQTRIFLNKNNMKSNYYKADNQGLWETITNNNIFKRDEFNIDSIDIVYEGTNPSTARKDVQVTMTFKVSSLDTLKCPISEPIQFGENTEVLELFHLVTLPNTGKISKNKSLEAKNKTDINEYDPSFSRVRLHVFKDELKDSEANSIIVDLTTIDHSISRDSNTGSTLFTINYRGYFETNYSMPKNDILSTAELRSQRKQIKEKISELKSLGSCKEVHLNAAKQLEQQWIDNNVSKNKVSTIINKLISEGKAYKALINKSQLISSAKGIFRADGNTNVRYFIEKVSADNTIQATTDKDLEEALNPESDENVDSRSKIGIGGVYTSTFCALGDLLDVVTSGVLTNDGGALENLTAIFGNIKLDNDRIVKPLDLPVDLGAFARWFDDNVTSKDLSFYPAVTFLRSFLIGFIDRYLGLECNKGTDSRPPNYRFMFHTTSRTEDLKLAPTQVDKTIEGYFLNIPDSDSPLLPRMPQAKIGETRDYIIFYQQTNASFVQKKFNENPHTPCIVYGTKNTRYNSLSDVSLSKNSAPYLREARYFNNDYGSLSLLANVYDLDFMFKDRNANTFFYPGVVFEFILNDWGNTMREDPLIQLETNGKDYEIFGDSNPHKSGTISNILGLGGYYIVKKVEYNLGNTNQDYTIKVSSKFIGSNHQPVIGRKKTENAENSDEQCSDILEEIKNIGNMDSNTSEPNAEEEE